MKLDDAIKTMRMIKKNAIMIIIMDIAPSLVALAFLIITKNDVYLFMMIVLFVLDAIDILSFAYTTDKFIRCIESLYDDYGEDDEDY